MTVEILPAGGWRERFCVFVESEPLQRIIMALIILNAVILGLETSQAARHAVGGLLETIDHILLAVFVVEIVAKLLGHGLRFFRSGWNLFDFIVVGIALVPATGPLSVLRALRILRVLRLLSVVPTMRRVVESLMRAIPGISSIAAILMLLFYVFSVVATNLFGGAFKEWFGDIPRSMYTLFQVMTLEGWSMDIVRPVMKTYPYSWAFFVPFILLTTFTMLNLFIAIIVSAMQERSESDHQEEMRAIENARIEEEAAMRREVGALRRDVAEIKTLLEQPRR